MRTLWLTLALWASTFGTTVAARAQDAPHEEEDDFGIATAPEPEAAPVPEPPAAPPPAPEPQAEAAPAPEPEGEAVPAEAVPAEAVPDAEEEAEEEAEPASAPPPSWDDLRVAGWTGFAISIAIGVTGGIVLATGVDEQNTVENAPDGIEWPMLAGAYERAPILQGAGAVALILGAAGLATSAILLTLAGPGGTWLQVSPSATGLSVRGRFW